MQLQFRDINIDDREIIDKYKRNWNIENAEMTFEHLYIWGADSFVQIAEDCGSLYIKLRYEHEPPLLMPPIPVDESVDYHAAVVKGREYFESRGEKVIFYSVCEPFADMFRKYCPEFELSEMREAWDYVYDSSDLITLKGKKYHSKRNFINRLKINHPDFEYRAITEADSDMCIELYDKWHSEHEDGEIDQYDERESVVRAVKNMSKLNLKGGAIFIDGKMAAFTVGGFVTDYMGHIHIEKALSGIDGLYPAVNQLFAEANYKDTLYINREEDMGLEGLRKAKESYYPAKMTVKYTAVLKNRCICKTICGNEIFKKESVPCSK
ncbi:phosphatidylglycerol lysyltransferase domain-containing protein [Lachnospiraceae bacterium NSJ-143]|nr:phosphatidylglycerol lysyltransferase domain-containing protein [Lachnospiraceae bacterium NSJ-143]